MIVEVVLRNAYIMWEGRKMSQGRSRRMCRSSITEAKGGNTRGVLSTGLEEWQGPGNTYLV